MVKVVEHGKLIERLKVPLFKNGTKYEIYNKGVLKIDLKNLERGI